MPIGIPSPATISRRFDSALTTTYIPAVDNGKFGARMAVFLSLGLMPAIICLVLWMKRKRAVAVDEIK